MPSRDLPKSPGELRAEAKRLYDLADTIKDADERLVHILRAMELETDAAEIQRQMDANQVQQGKQPPPQQERQPAQQQQHIQPKDDGKE